MYTFPGVEPYPFYRFLCWIYFESSIHMRYKIEFVFVLKKIEDLTPIIKSFVSERYIFAGSGIKNTQSLLGPNVQIAAERFDFAYGVILTP